MRLRHPPDRHIVSISAVCCRGLIYLAISPRSFPPSEKGDPVNTAEKHLFFLTNVGRLYQEKVIYASAPHDGGVESP